MFIHTTLFGKGSKHLIINECVQNSPDDAKYHEKNDRKCLAECNIEGKKFKYRLTCIEECSEVFYFEGNECKSMCTNKYFKKIYLDNALTKYNYQCIQVSDDYILSNDNSKDECIEKFLLREEFIGKGKVCRASCGNLDGFYYEKEYA